MSGKMKIFWTKAYVRVYDDVEDFIGVYQYHEKEREYRIRKMFYIKEEK